MLFGAAYYHEYQPYERLTEDIHLMQEAGFTCVRVGESVWSTWEPEDGQFALSWMERILDALYAAGIQVLLGTPTYALPPWLARQHPEIMAQYAQGRHAWYGGRQNSDVTHPTFRRYAERIIRTLAKHFAAHPAIIGFQLDNEVGTTPALHNPGVFQQFVTYLQGHYESVERLNADWGLTYWSQRLHTWEDLWTPDGNTSPGYDLAWRRFQAQIWTDFVAWQATIVREYARSDQFLTHDLVSGHGVAGADRFALAQTVDISAENPYYALGDDFDLRDSQTHSTGFGDARSRVWPLYQQADLGWSGRQANFLVTETNAQNIFGAAHNLPVYDGQWQQAACAFISRGANMISYWHWHTLHYGNENYWGGVLGHDLAPGRCYHEVQRIGQFLRQHGDLLTDLQPEAEVAFLYSQDSKYALEFQPCLTLPDMHARPDPQSYQRIFNTCYRAFWEARAQAAIVHPQQPFDAYPVLVVPALYIADDALLERLAAYAQAGGHLVLTFRSGYADADGRIRWQRAPGPLRTAVGASYQEYANLLTPLALRSDDATFALPADAQAVAWADGLALEGATPLVWYDHPHFGRFPALVSQPYGAGRVTYLGTLPNASFGQALATWVLQRTNVSVLGSDLSPTVRVTRAHAKTGQQVWFVNNWSGASQQVQGVLPAGEDLTTGNPLSLGQTLELGPWGCHIILANEVP